MPDKHTQDVTANLRDAVECLIGGNAEPGKNQT
jgi:hypothetical protein